MEHKWTGHVQSFKAYMVLETNLDNPLRHGVDNTASSLASKQLCLRSEADNHTVGGCVRMHCQSKGWWYHKWWKPQCQRLLKRQMIHVLSTQSVNDCASTVEYFNHSRITQAHTHTYTHNRQMYGLSCYIWSQTLWDLTHYYRNCNSWRPAWY